MKLLLVKTHWSNDFKCKLRNIFVRDYRKTLIHSYGEWFELDGDCIKEVKHLHKFRNCTATYWKGGDRLKIKRLTKSNFKPSKEPWWRFSTKISNLRFAAQVACFYSVVEYDENVINHVDDIGQLMKRRSKNIEIDEVLS